MIRILIAAGLLTALAPAHADQFFLSDESGNKQGPFEFRQGEQLTLAGTHYTIAKVLTKKQEIMERMKTIIIPQVEFRQAHIRDVIDFLSSAGMDYDGTPGPHRGVNLILNLEQPKSERAASEDPFGGDLFDDPGAPAGKPSGRLITFSARHISLYDAMNIVCRMCELEWSIQSSAVIIEPMKVKGNRADHPPPGQ